MGCVEFATPDAMGGLPAKGTEAIKVAKPKEEVQRAAPILAWRTYTRRTLCILHNVRRGSFFRQLQFLHH